MPSPHNLMEVILVASTTSDTLPRLLSTKEAVMYIWGMDTRATRNRLYEARRAGRIEAECPTGSYWWTRKEVKKFAGECDDNE